MEAPIVEINQLSKTFNKQQPPALLELNVTIPPGKIVGLAGPDGAGKTTLIRLIAGLLLPSEGSIKVAGYDTVQEASAIHYLTGYMPQKFGLYEDLTVMQNLRLYADLRGVTGKAREEAFERLLAFTGLKLFIKRLSGDLSGGMKQKLGLACALIQKPALLLLDEPSVGVDPLSRRELWSMVQELISEGISVLWSTAYLDEAEKCDSVLLLNEGRLLYHGLPDKLTGQMEGKVFVISNIQQGRRSLLTYLLRQPNVIDGVIQGKDVRIVTKDKESLPLDLEAAAPVKKEKPAGCGASSDSFCSSSVATATHSSQTKPAEAPRSAGFSFFTGAADLEALNQWGEITISPAAPRFEDAFIDILGGGPGGDSPLAENTPRVVSTLEHVIEAKGLVKKFGTFTAANDITFKIHPGEIFGLLGPNGAGKSTTFKMMCGLLKPTAGESYVEGFNLQEAPSEARSQIGYMAQKFSLYGNLSVMQNLEFFSGIYSLKGRKRTEMMQEMIDIFSLKPYLDESAETLPLGFKQRLALSCSLMHYPKILFLDEPTSGVDPITRREFWNHINGLVEKNVTVMVTTHFMDEAEYCDRIGLVYRSRLIMIGTPDELKDQARTDENPSPTLEDAFIALIQEYDRKQDAAGNTSR